MTGIKECVQVATPDVREEKLTSHDDAMILASDGLWDVLTNQEAVSLIKDIPVRIANSCFCLGGSSEHLGDPLISPLS